MAERRRLKMSDDCEDGVKEETEEDGEVVEPPQVQVSRDFLMNMPYG